MYNIVENVLKQGGYNLNDIIRKIDSLWVQGTFTDDERESLLSLARGGAKKENSLDVLAKFDEFERRIRALENNTNVPEDTEEYPEYQDGKWYYKNDKATFDGEKYICIAPDGVVCVWSPSAYPAYWEKV